jgi:hypothetical protein
VRTVSVFALVSDASGANDGLFTYDQQLILTNLLTPADPPAVTILGPAVRPDVEPTLAGGNGVVTASGIKEVAGGYDEMGRGIGAAQLLFQVQIEAVTPGTVNVVAGPDTVPYGYDIVLWESMDDVSVVYAAGPTLTVVVPEPASMVGVAGSGLVGSIVLGRGRGRLQRAGRGVRPGRGRLFMS